MGPGLRSHGRSRIEDSGWGSEGQRLLRTADRQSAAGVFGLVHSTERATGAAVRQRMDAALQPRAAASEPWAGNSRSSRRAARDTAGDSQDPKKVSG
jgi:hypothetical protein